MLIVLLLLLFIAVIALLLPIVLITALQPAITQRRSTVGDLIAVTLPQPGDPNVPRRPPTLPLAQL